MRGTRPGELTVSAGRPLLKTDPKELTERRDERRHRMRMRTLGGTGMRVSAYCLGAMMFGSGGNPDHEDCVRIIHTALDGGINFIDTADVYSAGESEEIVGQALRGRRDDVVLATKAHGAMGRDINMKGNSRRWIVREVENSLRRLQTDYIDLYQIHRPDHPHRYRGDLVRAVGPGAFRQGAGDRHPRRSRPSRSSRPSGWRSGAVYVRFRCEQPPYSIFARGIEASVLPTCEKYGMGVIPWSPLDGGWLTGRIRKDTGVDMTTGRARRCRAASIKRCPGTRPSWTRSRN